jgi:DNA-binding MarR family transcriptional regulator
MDNEFSNGHLESLEEFVYELVSQNLQNSQRSTMGITFTHESILRLLREQSKTASELAKKLKLTPGAITGNIDELERRGYIGRNRSTTDRRVVWLNLTTSGEEVLDQLLASQRRSLGRLFKALGTMDSLKFMTCIEKINRYLGEEN